MTSKDLLSTVYGSVREVSDLLSPKRVELIEDILVKAYNLALEQAAEKAVTRNTWNVEYGVDIQSQVVDRESIIKLKINA
jgi:hypothetical protein